jgi:catechol 2,3-dioxygenase-like lactoylglutathione lyase family enzyme
VIDHVSIAVSDLAAAAKFYESTLAPLGYALLEERPTTVGFGKRYAEFWINLRMSPLPSSGAHVALRAAGTAAVDAFHAAALAAGGTCDGPPGLRPQYGESYYAAFIRDVDGNRIEAVTFPGAAGHRSV